MKIKPYFAFVVFMFAVFACFVHLNFQRLPLRPVNGAPVVPAADETLVKHYVAGNANTGSCQDVIATVEERHKMTSAERIALIENVGYVPSPNDMSDYIAAEKTSWWGKRLDPAQFWTNRVVWYDHVAEFEARRRGRGYPPMPYEDTSVADRSDIDRQADGSSVENRNPRYWSSDRERVFWNRFGKSHPHPPEEIADWLTDCANNWLGIKHTLENDPQMVSRTRMKPSRLSEKLETDMHDTKTFWYPTECVNPEAYYWTQVMAKREEYEARIKQLEGVNQAIVDNFFEHAYVAKEHITEPLTPKQIKSANAWKVKYLRRLRAEKWDESYITAYKEAWSLTEQDLAEPTVPSP